MKTSNETYVHITKGTGDDAQESVVPASRVEKLVKDGKEQFVENKRQEFTIVEIESEEEFNTLVPDASVRIDILNRGYVLRQQQLARGWVLDGANQPSANAVDLTELAAQPIQRRTADPKTKAKNAFTKLAQEDPEAFAELLRQFNEMAAVA